MMIPLQNVTKAEKPAGPPKQTTVGRAPAGRAQQTQGRAVMPQAPAEPPAPSGRDALWKPYRWPKLDKVSKQQVSLLRRLEWMLPNVRSTGEVSESVKRRLSELMEEPVSLQAEYVHIVPPSKVRQYVSEPTFLAVLAPQPNKTRGLLEVEINLAHTAIDMLMGGAGEAVALRPLTDIEEGVMTYVIIETLKALAPTMDQNMPKLRVEGLAKSFDEAMTLLGEVENLAVVQLRASIGSQTGYLRLFIPESVLAQANPPPMGQVRRARRSAEASAHAMRLRLVRCWVRAEIGTVDIMAADLAQVRPKDVIIVDSLSARPDKKAGGTARLRVGYGRMGYVRAEVLFEGGRFKCRVGEPVAAEQPLDGRPPDMETGEGAPPAEGGSEGSPAPASDEDLSSQDSVHEEPVTGVIQDMDDNKMEGSDLLGDVPLQIMVELGRVSVTAEDVVAMKVGHVLDLNKTAGEPVELSVNGKVVARGEVVEIDGSLGVRIVSLAG